MQEKRISRGFGKEAAIGIGNRAQHAFAELSAEQIEQTADLAGASSFSYSHAAAASG